MPSIITADAGYGSEENYQFAETGNITAYVKYNQFDNEQAGIQSKGPFTVESFNYDKEQDCYYCPAGQRLDRYGKTKRITDTGYEQDITLYKAKDCKGCQLRSRCLKNDTDRRILGVNENQQRLKAIAHKNLTSEEGVRHRKKRPCDVEPVFAYLKYNHGFTRFMLRGKEKVAIETGLLALAHNFRKKVA